MGYKPRNKIYVLQFEDEDYSGLEVQARGVSTGKLLALMDLADQADKARAGKDAVNEFRGLLNDFGARLVAWNVEDEQDQPVPATMDGILSQDFDFVLDIILAWIDAMTGKADQRGPLERRSPNGEQSPVPSDPMEASLASLSN